MFLEICLLFLIFWSLSKFLYQTNTYECHLDDTGLFRWSELIEGGIKTYEGRLQQGKWMKMKSGDHLIFHCHNGESNFKLLCKVIDFKYFNHFGEAFETLGASLIPAISTEQANEVYGDYFSEKEIREYQVVCVGIQFMGYLNE